MWKYVTRRIRDALEKSVNHFDKRSSTGVVNSTGNSFTEDQNKHSGTPSCWLSSRKCWKSFYNENDTNSKKWNFDDLNRSWINAITWVIDNERREGLHLSLSITCKYFCDRELYLISHDYSQILEEKNICSLFKGQPEG